MMTVLVLFSRDQGRIIEVKVLEEMSRLQSDEARDQKASRMVVIARVTVVCVVLS